MIPLQLKPSQKVFFNSVLSKKHTEILYAGTAGTGKTFSTCCLFIMFLNDFSNSRLGVFRKNLTTARKTVWHTYIKALNLLQIPYRETKGSEPKIFLPNSNSVIEFFEMDVTKDPDWNKIKGLELTFAHIEEANEVDITGRNILITRIGRWNSNKCPAFIIMTCNPAQGWVRDQYREPFLNGTLLSYRSFIETTADELDPAYRLLLETLPEIEKERYLNNNWNYGDDPSQLIKYEWLKDNFCEPSEEADELGIDVAREGNDRTILSYIFQKQLKKQETLNTQNVAVVGDIAIQRMLEKRIPAPSVKIDIIGVGAGTCDYMRLRNYQVTSYNSGSSPDKQTVELQIQEEGKAVETRETPSLLQFKNKRAQDYWELREGLREGHYKLLNDVELIRELTNIKYFVKDKFIQIESKSEIKKRLGVSPDKADSFCIGISKTNNGGFGFAFV